MQLQDVHNVCSNPIFLPVYHLSRVSMVWLKFNKPVETFHPSTKRRLVRAPWVKVAGLRDSFQDDFILLLVVAAAYPGSQAPSAPYLPLSLLKNTWSASVIRTFTDKDV